MLCQSMYVLLTLFQYISCELWVNHNHQFLIKSLTAQFWFPWRRCHRQEVLNEFIDFLLLQPTSHVIISFPVLILDYTWTPTFVISCRSTMTPWQEDVFKQISLKRACRNKCGEYKLYHTFMYSYIYTHKLIHIYAHTQKHKHKCHNKCKGYDYNQKLKCGQTCFMVRWRSNWAINICHCDGGYCRRLTTQ